MTISRFDESYDVIVAGFGLAGGIAALNAKQAGAQTLLIEKSSVPGGLSICSYGAVRSARDPEQAFLYLKTTNDGRTPDDVLRVLATGMCGLETYVRELGKINNAVIATSVFPEPTSPCNRRCIGTMRAMSVRIAAMAST